MHNKDDTLNALVIDDTAAIRSYIRQILQQLGVQNIMEAADGVSARILFEQYHPRLVFLDIQLPDISGKTLLRQFRQHDQNTAIFMVSAFSSVDNLKEAIDNGADAFVLKPFSAQRICNLVQPLLSA